MKQIFQLHVIQSPWLPGSLTFMLACHLTFSRRVPASLSEARDFFSSPMNLDRITPPDTALTVTSKLPPDQKMYPGMIITYKVSPFAGIKLNWMTEITQVADHKYVIGEQRFDPYKFWHHQHQSKKYRVALK